MKVEAIERDIDAISEGLPQLKSFVVPDGRPAAAFLHLARTVVRRAERSVCSMDGFGPERQAVIPYLNRLSDLLFVLARRER